ncbi:MAG: beta-glucosidase BglX [Candidatus Neomarinimicrobiota bacterium]|nr:MAG: beta-glucosidase BglX [Candidatus Neomarinimicrobiota bacterium]
MNVSFAMPQNNRDIEQKIDQLLAKMTLAEKIGQMSQRNGFDGNAAMIKAGKIGSLLNEVDPDKIRQAQKLAVEQSPNGIPLLIGRDVIHGFRTIFPIPLGLAATWNPEGVRKGARISAKEAASIGINWTFAPMMDIARDSRWGRIAESFGEDPYLASKMAVAMIEGFQTDDLSRPDAIAACAKHFAGYGAVEGGRDYNTVYIPEQLLREVYLKPFNAAVDAGVSTFMTAFSDLNGIPSTANNFTLKQILRNEWNFDGFVVSDWASISEMITHGYCTDERDAAEKAVNAGVDMEMATSNYEQYLKELIEAGEVSMETVDNAVRNILRIKYRLGLFEHPYVDATDFPEMVNDDYLKTAGQIAAQSIVMLKNENNILPLSKNIKDIAVIGPMADDKFEQLGTWTFDKQIEDTHTPLQALKEYYRGKANIHYSKGLEISRSRDHKYFKEAIKAAKKSDVVLMFMGEEAIITGEAHCRANINLPGGQEELIKTIARTGTPIVMIVMSGRALTMGNILDDVDAILYAFHPGTMGGPAIVDLLTGKKSPSGKLPITFPKVVGQIPIYYNHKNTGRPPIEKNFVQIDDIPVRAWQTSLGNESHYIDAGYKPQFPFGFGLSYTTFAYSDIRISNKTIKMGDEFVVSATITNTGNMEGDEIVQFYTHDISASITPPVKELKGFQRITLKPGQSKIVEFKLHTDDLAFYNQEMKEVTEPGKFQFWIAPNSDSGSPTEFEVVK